jgi:hypothetical protein
MIFGKDRSNFVHASDDERLSLVGALKMQFVHSRHARSGEEAV